MGHQQVIGFLNAIERAVPAGKVVHVILDNDATHQHPKVKAWLARNPRFVFHFTRFIEADNDDPKPFVWTADTERILVGVQRGIHTLTLH